LLAAGSCASSTLAQQEGDKVVVIAQKAPLRSVEDTTGTVTKGAILVVRNVNSDWFWVTWSNGYGTVKGWINHADIVPYSQALAFFTRELMQNPTATAYNTRGTIWNERGEHDRAIEDFSEAIRLDPEVKQFYNNRGVAWDDKAHYEEAIDDYDRAIELDPRYSLAFNNRGNAWSALADYSRAIADYSEAIRLDPKDSSAFFNRAHAWSVRDEYDKAISDYKRGHSPRRQRRVRIQKPSQRLVREARVRQWTGRLQQGDSAQSERRARPPGSRQRLVGQEGLPQGDRGL
jgi:tetratricopeptide (TPR) repeat protein